MSERPTISSPGWLVVLFAVEGLGWLLQAIASVFFLFMATRFDELSRVLFLVLQIVALLGVAAAFVWGIVRPITTSAGQRFAFTHCVAGALSLVPWAVLSVGMAVSRVGDGRFVDAVSTAAMGIAFLAVPVAGIFASRASKPPWLVIATIIGVLSVGWGALSALGLGVGVAGITA